MDGFPLLKRDPSGAIFPSFSSGLFFCGRMWDLGLWIAEQKREHLGSE